jgi:hypothetical protein
MVASGPRAVIPAAHGAQTGISLLQVTDEPA